MTSVPFPGDEEEDALKKKDYGVRRYAGLTDAVNNVRKQVEKDRLIALDREKELNKQILEKEAAARSVQKELSVQLRVAGRSYDQLLCAVRELSEDLRKEQQDRVAEVDPLKAEIKRLNQVLSKIEQPWKDEVKKRDATILKLQEGIAPLEQKIRDEKIKMQPVIDKFKAEIKVREEATEVVLKEVKYWEDYVKDVQFKAAAELQAEKDARAEEIAPIRNELAELKAKHAVATDPFKKEIKDLKCEIEVLKQEIAQVDYSPYIKKLEIKEAGLAKIIRDFDVKEAYNRESIQTMREGFEGVIMRMDNKIKHLEAEKDALVKPYENKIELLQVEIEGKDAKIKKLKETEEHNRAEFKMENDEIRKELDLAKQSMDFGEKALLQAKRQLEQKTQEFEMDGGPMKKVRMLELKLDEVTLRCQQLIKIRDDDLAEKTLMIQRIQRAMKEKSQQLHELDQSWNKKIQQKEDGYLRVASELTFAEGQIVEERRKTAEKVREVHAREKDIHHLKEAHTEELKCRNGEIERLENKIREIHHERTEETGSLVAEIRRLEGEVEYCREQALSDVADLRIDLSRKDKAKKIIEEENERVKQEMFDARKSFEEKERELDTYIRNRDRHIAALKNEIEIVSDSWEIKYNTLVALFEKLQKKYDETVGPNGMLEQQRRNKDLKDHIMALKSEIGDLKEQLKKCKRRIRDLELDIDFTLKNTADIIAEKERGVAKMVGDYAKLKAQFNDAEQIHAMVLKEKDMEMVALAESFEGRISELEQLVESLRFTDREALCERIEGWKDAYTRVCLDRDQIEEDLSQQITIKESQLLNMAEEVNIISDKMVQKQIDFQVELDEAERKFLGKKAVLDEEKRVLQQQILDLEAKLARKQKELERALLISDAPSDDAEVLRLEAELKQKEEQIQEVEKGYSMLVENFRDMSQVVETAGVDTDAIHEGYKEQLEAKDKEISKIIREHGQLREVMEQEVYIAQQACRTIEERIKKFPNPFEIEVREMRDKYAQMQAGMVNLSLENVNQRDEIDKLKLARQVETEHLEKQLQEAVRILKEVAGIGFLQSMTPQQVRRLEESLGVDLDGDGSVGAPGD